MAVIQILVVAEDKEVFIPVIVVSIVPLVLYLLIRFLRKKMNISKAM
jgi:hypothetical protein